MVTPKKLNPQKAGKKPFIPTPEQLKRVHKVASQGMLERDIAFLLGIHPGTLPVMKAKFPELNDAIKKGTAEGIEDAIKGLKYHITKKNLTALLFYLKCKGGFKEDGTHDNDTVAATDSQSTADRILGSVQRVRDRKLRGRAESSD